jgi:hypothetical protein
MVVESLIGYFCTIFWKALSLLLDGGVVKEGEALLDALNFLIPSKKRARGDGTAFVRPLLLGADEQRRACASGSHTGCSGIQELPQEQVTYAGKATQERPSTSSWVRWSLGSAHGGKALGRKSLSVVNFIGGPNRP